MPKSITFKLKIYLWFQVAISVGSNKVGFYITNNTIATYLNKVLSPLPLPFPGAVINRTSLYQVDVHLDRGVKVEVVLLQNTLDVGIWVESSSSNDPRLTLSGACGSYDSTAPSLSKDYFENGMLKIKKTIETLIPL